MKKAEHKSFKSPDDVRTFEKGKVELLNIGGGVVGLFRLEPGWKWSKHIKPIAKTEHCEVAHFQYLLSGRMHVVMTDGKVLEVSKGDVIHIPQGHDAWVLGDEPVIAVDWTGATHYAEKK